MDTNPPALVKTAALELIIGTALPATPLIVVIKLFTALVLATEFTAFAVAVFQFTVEVITLPAVPNTFVVEPAKIPAIV